jgi:hypothetical protein
MYIITMICIVFIVYRPCELYDQAYGQDLMNMNMNMNISRGRLQTECNTFKHS